MSDSRWVPRPQRLGRANRAAAWRRCSSRRSCAVSLATGLRCESLSRSGTRCRPAVSVCACGVTRTAAWLFAQELVCAFAILFFWWVAQRRSSSSETLTRLFVGSLFKCDSRTLSLCWLRADQDKKTTTNQTKTSVPFKTNASGVSRLLWSPYLCVSNLTSPDGASRSLRTLWRAWYERRNSLAVHHRQGAGR